MIDPLSGTWKEKQIMHGQLVRGNLMGFHFTPMVAPSFDGRSSWFAFEEAIYDWLDITTLAPDTWAPSLKARLAGDASIYKPLLDRERLRDPNDGGDYFKQLTEATLRERESRPCSYSSFTS